MRLARASMAWSAMAIQAWTAFSMPAEDRRPDGRPGVTPAMAAAIDAAKEGRLADTLAALGKALIAARQRGDLRLAEAIEQRYRATWRDVGNLRRSAIQVASQCNPTQARELHAQLVKAGLPDTLTSAASGVTYDLRLDALKTLLSHIARVSGDGSLGGDLSAIGDALAVAEEHKLDEVPPALVKRYQALWQQVESLHRRATAAVGNPKATEAVRTELHRAVLPDEVKNALNGAVLTFPTLRASLRAPPVPPPSAPSIETPPPRAEPPVTESAAPPQPPQPRRPEPIDRAIRITRLALALVLAALVVLLLPWRSGRKRATEATPLAEATGEGPADPSAQPTDPRRG